MNDELVKMENSKPQNKLRGSEVLSTMYEHINRLNGEINRMSTKQLIERLKYFGLDTGGNDDVKRNRLKNNYRKITFASMNVNISNNLLPYYVVIDFEATCLDSHESEFQQEIIEFPAVLINSSTQEIEDTFQMYCKPVINPKLSDFCVKLTGITQEQVDSANSFSHVFECFEKWLKNHKLGGRNKFCIVTDTPWDMSRYLFQQCNYSSIRYPGWANKWINIRRSFCAFYKCDKMPLKNMLNYLDMEFEGHLHCGLDDAKNIARILLRMISDGANIHPNERINKNPKHLNKNSKESVTSTESKQDASVDDKNKSGPVEKTQNPRRQAYFFVIKSKDDSSTYEKIKRQRRKLEEKINRELKESSDKLENGEELKDVLKRLPSLEINKNE